MCIASSSHVPPLLCGSTPNLHWAPQVQDVLPKTYLVNFRRLALSEMIHSSNSINSTCMAYLLCANYWAIYKESWAQQWPQDIIRWMERVLWAELPKKKAQMYKINDTKVDWKSKQCKGQRKKKTVSKIPTVLKLCHRAHCHLMITSGLAARDSAGMTIYVLNCKEMNQTISGEIV